MALDKIDPTQLSAISLYLEKESVDFLQDKVVNFQTTISDLRNRFKEYRVNLKHGSQNAQDADDDLQITEDSLNKKKWSFVIGESE